MGASTRNVAVSSVLLLLLAATGCDRSQPEPSAASEPGTPSDPAASAIKTDKGVDLASKTIKIGVLNDESGPAAAIGKPYALGTRIVAAQINAGGSGLLPEGWKVELVERDHGYNPQKSVLAYNNIKDEVLLIAHSFGTPNTRPLWPVLERDSMLALPGSFSSQMASHRSTPPPGPSYEVEAMRAFDWLVAATETAGKKKDDLKVAVVYQQDDYGQDGQNGWKRAAEHHGVKLVSEQAVMPGQRDFTAVVTALKTAGATHVMLTILPSATAPLLGTATQLKYKPTWLGQSPSWNDGFFDPKTVPATLFDNYYWTTGSTYWAEDVPGMPRFMEAWDRYGKAQGAPDYSVLVAYTQTLMAIDIVKRAIEAGDVTRAGVMAQVPKVTAFDGGGLLQPIDLSKFPYVTSTRTRVLKPDFTKHSWTVVGDWASPSTLGAPPSEGS